MDNTLDKYRFIVADDDPTSLYVIQKSVKKLACDICAATDGSEALDYLHSKQFDCAILDIQMPQTSGITVMQAIRKGECGNNPKDMVVIAITAYSTLIETEYLIKSGFNGVITKPFNFSDLHRLLEKHL